MPWLLVHGTEDAAVPFDEARKLLDYAAANSVQGENAKLLSLEGTGHTFGATHPFDGPAVHLEQACATVVNHFLRTL
ncbi:hypothetical protein D3C83_196990 [compost metagenome]